MLIIWQGMWCSGFSSSDWFWILNNYTRFQCYVHSGYLSTSFDNHLSTSSCDVLIKMSQSQPMHADVCFMSLLCKWATSLKGYVSGLWLVDFDLSCLLSMSKDGWQKISAMHVTLKAGIKTLPKKRFLVWLPLPSHPSGNSSLVHTFLRILVLTLPPAP